MVGKTKNIKACKGLTSKNNILKSVLNQSFNVKPFIFFYNTPMALLYPLTLVQKKKEAKDSVSMVLKPPAESREVFRSYLPAQFLSFEFLIQGKKFLRSYSLSSCPLLEEELTTTVKKVPDGVVSNHILDHLKEGDVILSRKPMGKFFKPPKDLKPHHYCLFAAGSGITPLFSILKTVLVSDPKNQVTLFYSNRNQSSFIYKKEIIHWLTRHAPRLRVFSFLSRPETTLPLLSQTEALKNPTTALPSSEEGEKANLLHIRGRLSTSFLKEYAKQNPLSPPGRLYYLCGPTGFMQNVESFLIQNQVLKTQIKTESFFQNPALSSASPVLKPKAEGEKGTSPSLEDQASLIVSGTEEKGKKSPPHTLRAVIEGEKLEIPSVPDVPVLEQLLSAGHSPPFSCLSGNCMSCLAVLKKGWIVQEEKGILEEENIKNCEILTCQAKPLSHLVEVDYDS